eukprot:TRINITY_DN66406_c0_g1_i2.p1 TRINITY_DN66406_c0_g1~~TRINITY_DN66406_c0_g1_i2.p1  ORF type:complete len:277 (+),score=16.79 TRINITY_DN66406_c0_g1_i2:182-1012(+)
MMLSAELIHHETTTLNDYSSRSEQQFQRARRLPWFARFGELGGWPLSGPDDANFNQDHFPHIPFGPIWPRNVVITTLPIASFLEAHFADFLEDLETLLTLNKTGRFSELHLHNSNAGSHYREFSAADGMWESVYLVRGQHWSTGACQVVAKSCALLQSRSELQGGGNIGAGFLKLSPGARLKPHFGEAPRLSAHLGLKLPTGERIELRVGGQTTKWVPGSVVVFDDTFAHSVLHDGTHPRYILNIWFHHPCDAEYGYARADEMPDYCSLPPGWATS